MSWEVKEIGPHFQWYISQSLDYIEECHTKCSNAFDIFLAIMNWSHAMCSTNLGIVNQNLIPFFHTPKCMLYEAGIFKLLNLTWHCFLFHTTFVKAAPLLSTKSIEYYYRRCCRDAAQFHDAYSMTTTSRPSLRSSWSPKKKNPKHQILPRLTSWSQQSD